MAKERIIATRKSRPPKDTKTLLERRARIDAQLSIREELEPYIFKSVHSKQAGCTLSVEHVGSRGSGVSSPTWEDELSVSSYKLLCNKHQITSKVFEPGFVGSLSDEEKDNWISN